MILTIAEAFNAGSDARLAGLPLAACPALDVLKEFWRQGWSHADLNWGKDSRRPAAPLPAVRGYAA